MRRYETIVILKPSLGEEENQAVIDRTTGIIEDFTGSVIKIDKWGLKKLAYLIKKESQGYYLYIVYAGMPAGVDEMERVFRIDDRVMKFLTVKLQEVYTPLPEDIEEEKPVEAAAAEETPKTSKPVVEEVAAETPAEEAPKTAEAVVEEVAAETPAEEAPKTAEAVVEEVAAEIPSEEAPETAEAVTEEAAAEKEE